VQGGRVFTAGCLPLLELGESDLGVMAKECAARGVGGTFADCIMRQQARGISGAYAHAGGGGAAEEEEEEEVANQTQKQKEGALSAKAAEWELKKAGREAGRQAKEQLLLLQAEARAQGLENAASAAGGAHPDYPELPAWLRHCPDDAAASLLEVRAKPNAKADRLELAPGALQVRIMIPIR